MHALIGFSALAIAMGLMTGCATKGEVQALDSRLSALEAKVSSLEGTAAKAISEANAAHEHAAKAQNMAEECHKICEAHSARMEKMFHRSMMK